MAEAGFVATVPAATRCSCRRRDVNVPGNDIGITVNNRGVVHGNVDHLWIR